MKVYGFTSTYSDPSAAALKFRLKDHNGVVLREDYYSSQKMFEIPVAAGTYTFEVFVNPAKAPYDSVYRLKLKLL